MTRDNSIVVEQARAASSRRARAPSTGSTSTSPPARSTASSGPNGAGKSTTVLMLTTLLPPTARPARVGGYDVRTEGPKVRSVIGAALQEAALDPLLTGRDHLRLQTMLQAIPRAERKPRQDELLDRVGLTEAADRKVGGYSGGMKRRLDLALALVHRPEHPLPRRADDGARPAEPHRPLGGGRAPRPRGQRHRLPDDAVPRGGRRARRPGRDHRPRQDRRRGHAGGAEGRDRPPQHPRDPVPGGRQAADRGAARRASASRSAASATSPCASTTASGMADVIRAMDASGIVVDDVELRAPTLDDVFLAKTGRTLEGAATDEDGAAGRMSALPTQVGALAQRSIMRTARQPASAIPPLLFPVALMLAQRGRPPGLDRAAGIPDRLVPRLRARGAVHPGRAVLDHERRHRPRPRHPDRVLLPALADARARRGAARRPARGDRRARRAPGGLLHRVRAAARRPLRRRARPGSRLLLVYAAIVAVGFGAIGSLLALRTGSGEAIQGLFPLLFVFLFISSMNTPRNLIAVGWFQLPRLDQPDLVPDRVRAQPDHHGLGRARPSRSGSASRSCSRSSRVDRREPRALGRRLERS